VTTAVVERSALAVGTKVPKAILQCELLLSSKKLEPSFPLPLTNEQNLRTSGTGMERHLRAFGSVGVDSRKVDIGSMTVLSFL
jgi:hypothetical protein